MISCPVAALGGRWSQPPFHLGMSMPRVTVARPWGCWQLSLSYLQLAPQELCKALSVLTECTALTLH
jgi:hypothetical protein